MTDANDTSIKTPGKIVSAGPATQATPAFAKPATETPTDQKPDAGAAAAGAGAAPPAGDPGANGKPPDEIKVPEMTDEQLKKLFAGKGIEFDGNFDTLKEKLTKADAPAPVELTAEQKIEQEKEMDKRIVAYYLKNGGTVETLVALKNYAAADLKELSVAEIKREMKAEGFNEKEIDLVLKERYYQLNPDELEKLEGESEEDFQARKELSKKKVAFGTKKLESKAAYIKSQAAKTLEGIKLAVETDALLEKEEAKFSSKVDEIAKNFPRKQTFELGEVDGKKLDPVTYEVAEADIADVTAMLKDPAKRQQFFYNADNSFNLDNVGKVLLRNKFLESALKASFLEGGSRQVAEFEKVFGGKTPHDIGVGGKAGGTPGQKGKIVSAGKPEFVVNKP